MMKTLSRFLFGTLRGRLIISVALVHAVMMSLFIIDLTTRQRDMLLERQVEEATALSQALATSAAGWIAADDVVGLQEIADAQLRYPETMFVILADDEGRVLAATDKSRQGQYMLDLPREARLTVLSSSPSLVDVAVPAMLGGLHVGWARVGIGQEVAGEKLVEIARSGIIYTLSAILIGSIIAWFMGGRISRRLYAVQETIDAVRSGNRQARSLIGGSDEAAVMAREFNSMLDELAERDTELGASEGKYRSLIQNVQTAIVLHDNQGYILVSNPLAQRLLGLAKGQLLGKTLIDPEWHFLREDGSVMPTSEYPASRVLASQQPLRDYIVGICRPDQDEITWALTNAEPEFNEAGAIEQIIVSFIDITGRKRAEEKLLEQARHSQSLLRLSRKLERAQTYSEVLNAAQDEVKAVIGYQNLWAYLLTDDKKYFKALIAGGPTSDIVMSEDGTATLTIENDQMLKEIADAKEIVVIEDAQTDERTNKEIVTRLGNRTLVNVPIILFDRHLGSVGTGTFGDEGVRVPTESERKYLVALASHMAVTLDRIHLLIERRQAAEDIRDLYNHAPCGYHSLDKDGVFIRMNDTELEWLGYQREEVIGKLKFSDIITASGQAIFKENFPRFKASGVIRNLEFEMIRKDSSILPVLVSATAITDNAGNYLMSRSTVYDITDRKRADDALRRLNRELRAISNCNQTLMRAVDEQTLLSDICRIVCNEAGYCMSWVGYAENDEAKTVRPAAWAGAEDGYLATADITWADTERGDGPAGTAIRTGESACIQDFTTDSQAAPWRESALQRGYHSSVALPLKDENARTFGVLCIYSTEPNAFIPDEMRLLEELAGDLAFGIVVLRARTERQRAEEKAAQLAAIVESSDDAIIGKTLDGIVTSWNKGAERIYGYAESEMVGKPISILVPPERADEGPMILEKIKMGEHIEHYETVRQRQDGQRIDMSLTISSVQNAEGEIIGVSTIGRDITERKRVEQGLHESEERFTAAFHASPNMISITQIADGTILEVNEGYSRLLGYSRAESIGKTMSELSIWSNPADRSIFIASLEGIGEIANFETTLRRKDGALVTVIDSARTIKLQGETCVLSVVHDITERKQAEEAVRAASVYNRRLIEVSLDPLVTIGPDGKITDVNEATETGTGVSRERLVGDDFSNYFTEPEKANEGYQKVLAQGLVRDYPLTMRHTSGKTTDVLYNATVYKNEAGEIQGVFAAARDITERKRAEEELHVSEEKFRAMVEQSSEGVSLIDETGMIVEWNQTSEKITGLKRGEVMGMPLWDMMMMTVAPERKTTQHSEAFKKIVLEALQTGQSYLFAKPVEAEFYPRSSSEKHYLHQTIFPIKTEKGYRIASLTQDITERKLAEEEIARSLKAEKKAREIAEILREANESLSRTLNLEDILPNLLQYLSRLVPYDSANVMLLEGDFQLRVVALCDYEHWTDMEMTQKITFDLRTSPVLNELVATQKSMLIANTHDHPGWIRPAGAEHVVNWLGVPIIAGRQVIGLYSVDKVAPGFFTDEHRLLAEGLAGQAAVAIQNARLHNQIKRANVELEERVTERTAELENANKELEAFAYSVSHDLRAPLRHIDGFIEMLQERVKKSLDDQSRHYMNVISDSAKTMGTLIDDLLSFSRMGRNEMFKSRVDLGELVQDVIQDLKPEAAGRDVQWQISPLPLISGDRAMLRVVLVNLISNALKFTRPRKIAQIEIGCKDENETEATIFIRDNGVGFDMNYADKLFGVFQRLHRQEDFEGTGIGLANVRRVISRHGGKTWAEGQVDHGATFYFSLLTSKQEIS